jgi:hypothetical protein
MEQCHATKDFENEKFECEEEESKDEEEFRDEEDQ